MFTTHSLLLFRSIAGESRKIEKCAVWGRTFKVASKHNNVHKAFVIFKENSFKK